MCFKLFFVKKNIPKSFSTVVAIFASEPFAPPPLADCTASGQLSTQLFCGMAEAYLCLKPESEFGKY